MSNRITTLIAALRENLSALEAEVSGQPIESRSGATPVTASATGYTAGMSAPDKYGRVRLEEIERLYTDRAAEFREQNRPTAPWFFLSAVRDFFPLNDFQRYHVERNTGDNANFGFAGRWGSAVKFEKREDGSMVELGRFTSTDPDGDTMALKARTVEGAVAEAKKALIAALEHEQKHGGPDPVGFGSRR
jgi:hypothetical protein